MAEAINVDRRRILGAGLALVTAAAAPKARAQAASFGPLKQIDAGVLRVGYAETGPADGTPVLLLHGWPYDIHTYRWRLGLAEGAAKYDALETRLAQFPNISVPAITLEGDANGAPHPDSSAYARRFSGKYAHRTLTGGVGHNLPQEAPGAFTQAIVDAARSAAP
jgi:pimeloyl-ACP methyl ester carboxylesterase